MSNILVIGGANGLGGDIASAFSRAGDNVLLADCCPPPQSILPDTFYLQADLDTADTGASVVQEAQERLAGLDALIIAASSMESAPIGDWTTAMWDRAFAINLRLPFLAAQAATPLLSQSRNASITIISSTATMRGQPFTHGYQATKAGVAGLVRSLAAELGPAGIRVNAMLGGWLDTPLTQSYWATVENGAEKRMQIDARIPLRRHGTSAEAVAFLQFLASDAASYLTGAMLPVDGGDTAV